MSDPMPATDDSAPTPPGRLAAAKRHGVADNAIARHPKVVAACVDLLFRTTPILAANLVCALVLVFAAHPILAPSVLYAWTGAIVSVSFCRFGLQQLYRRRTVRPADAYRWGILYSIGAGISGVIWAAAIIMVFQAESFSLHAITIIMVAGLAAGIATSGSSFLLAFYGFAVPALSVLSVMLLMTQQREYMALLAATVLFALLITRVARRMNQSLVAAFALRLKNEQLVEDLQAALEALQASNRAKSEFLANMSHELRTPLNAIIGFSGMIMSEALGPIGSPRYREYARDIQESGAHLLGLISNILDVSKIESGQVELRPVEIEIQEVVQSCITIIKNKARTERIALAVDIAPALPTLVADEVKLKQVLINLLTNAVKFTQAGGSVSVRVRRGAGGTYRIDVTDTGVGIAREDIPKALAAFRQVSNSRQGHNEGTGLGLTLAKSLVELHGGTLELESEVGVGTTVTLEFPKSSTVAATPARDAPPAMSATGD